MTYKLTDKLIYILPLMSLVGCSTYKEQFDCPVGTGLGCASLAKVNKEMDKGHISIEDDRSPREVTDTAPHVVWGQSFTALR